MEIYFEKEYLRELYEDGKTSDKKYRFQSQIVAKYQLRIKLLEKAKSVTFWNCQTIINKRK